MSPPRWPFLVEIDAMAQLNLYFGSGEQKTTVPLGMRIVGRNMERDTYFVAPWGLHLLYRRMMRRFDKAQQVLMKLRGTPPPAPVTTAAWPPQYYPIPLPQASGFTNVTNIGSGGSGGSVTYTLATPSNYYGHNPCLCPLCQPAANSSIQQTP